MKILMKKKVMTQFSVNYHGAKKCYQNHGAIYIYPNGLTLLIHVPNPVSS